MIEAAARNLFISYAREDRTFAEALHGYLFPLIQQGKLNVFIDTRDIEKGDDWHEKITAQLKQADAVLLLVSQHYFRSEYVMDTELPAIVERYKANELACWPFIASDYPWDDFIIDGFKLSAIQAIGPFDADGNLRPLNALPVHDQEAQLTKVYIEVRDWIGKLELQEQQELEARRLEEEARAREAKRLEEETRAREAKRLEEEAQTREAKRLEEEAQAREVKRLEEEAQAREAKRLYDERRAQKARQRQQDREQERVSVREAEAELLEKSSKAAEPTRADAAKTKSSAGHSTPTTGRSAFKPGYVYFALLLVVAVIVAYQLNSSSERQQQEQLAMEAARSKAEAERRQQAEADAKKAAAEAEARRRTERIASLINTAERQIAADKLTSPPRDNALESIRAVQELQRDNEFARELLDTILGRYLQLAEQAKNEREFDRARTYLKRARLLEVSSAKIDLALQALDLAEGLPPALSVFQDRLSSGGKGPPMVVIPAGSFVMGSPESELGHQVDEGPQHEVHIKVFALGKTEVSFDAYDRFVERTGHATDAESTGGCYTWNETAGEWQQEASRHWRAPGFAQAGDSPVACVSWNDANAYAEWLSVETGQNYRLPTEAEWEYAARAGTTTRYSWGEDIDCTRARYGASSCESDSTSPVGSYPANPFGLHDMHGNVWEWTRDCWHDTYAGAPADGGAWTDADRGDCSRRVVRGGGWSNLGVNLRSADRFGDNSDVPDSVLGFRLARAL